MKDFNFTGGGRVGDVIINIDKTGHCKIYVGMDRILWYSGKYKPVMRGYKVYRKNSKVYVAMLDNKGRVENGCMDYDGNEIPCVFELH